MRLGSRFETGTNVQHLKYVQKALSALFSVRPYATRSFNPGQFNPRRQEKQGLQLIMTPSFSLSVPLVSQ
jgi:hypothetical protein